MVVVLVMVALSAMVAAGLLYRMRAEASAGAVDGRGQQAQAAVMSGLNRALTVLTNPQGQPKDWGDNPDLFKDQLVCSDGGNKWYFTVYASSADGKTLRYGLEDEAGLINIDFADAATLARLPNMTPELVDCLMDYIDSDSTPRTGGAEQEYYAQLRQPYYIKNGPLGTLEELLLVKGFNAGIVYGEDANFNGVLDPNENDGDKSFPPDNSDGQLDRGLAGVATVLSREVNVDHAGQLRVNINGTPEDLQKLAKLGLPKETLTFIQAYRTDGNMFKHPSQLLGMTYQPKATGTAQPDLPPTVTGTVRPRGGRGPATGTTDTPLPELSSGIGPDQLATVLDQLTTLPVPKSTPLPGLVNVNTASPAVLAALGIDPAIAQQIADARTDLPAVKKQTPAWLVTENLMPADKFKEIAPRLTARSFQYRIRVIGFGVPCGSYKVIETVVDLTGSAPRIVYYRDISGAGLPAAVTVDNEK